MSDRSKTQRCTKQKNNLRRCRRLFPILGGVVIAVYMLVCLYCYGNVVTLDYWIWLGCPTLSQMSLPDNYPGHDLTASLRHADYYEQIPHTGASYNSILKTYGEPQSLCEYDHPSNPDCVCMDAAYPGFTVHLVGERDLDIGERHAVYTIVTTDEISFTHMRFHVGDTRTHILYCSRYYTGHVKAKELEPGFSWGYIDGSGLTMWTFVEFQFDASDRASAILLYNPW